jgi:S-adenosylmethionine decarboxylase
MEQTSPLPENIASAEELAALIETPINDNAPKDYFVERNGEVYAGAHVLADLWGAERLDDIEYMEDALRKAIEVCGATLLHIHLHHFGEGCGVSGVAVLAESHISVHTWPERGFAAFDIFMCGSCDPELALPVLQKHFNPERMDTELQKRGKIA